MCYFGKETFAVFLCLEYGMEIVEEAVQEESQLLYKEELDAAIISKELLNVAGDTVLFDICTYITNENEWIVCVASDADTSYPLFLYCLKDGIKVYEEVLKEE